MLERLNLAHLAWYGLVWVTWNSVWIILYKRALPVYDILEFSRRRTYLVQ